MNYNKIIRITANLTFLCFHGAIKLLYELVLISADGYRAAFTGNS